MGRIIRAVLLSWRYQRLHLLTGQCALIFGEALEFVIDVKEPLQESAKFTLGLRLQLRLE